MEDVCTKFRQTKCCFEVLQQLKIKHVEQAFLFMQSTTSLPSTAERVGLGKSARAFYHYCEMAAPDLHEKIVTADVTKSYNVLPFCYAYS